MVLGNQENRVKEIFMEELDLNLKSDGLGQSRRDMTPQERANTEMLCGASQEQYSTWPDQSKAHIGENGK